MVTNASIVAQAPSPAVWKELWRMWQGKPYQGSMQVITVATGEPAAQNADQGAPGG